jgi:flagellar biosynthesis/type III secretory pathway protein FliH
MKTAAVLAENEKTAELVHASQCGRAFASAALEVFAQADSASKMAMDQTEKLAAEEAQTDAMVKQAAQQGYDDTMQKVAADYNQGYDQGINDAIQAAANEFYKGAQEADIIVRAVMAQQGQ